MNITVLSDLYWESHLKNITSRDLGRFKIKHIDKPIYYSIKRYLQIILDEKSDIVLFAGDITGDGSCSHGFQKAFIILVSILETLKIHTCYISGNHDEVKYYQELSNFTKSLNYIHQIDNTYITIYGKKILGIPYATSSKKSKLKKFLSKQDQQFDIVLAHAQLKRRIRLFHLNTKIIVTGHYDRKLMAHNKIAFLSLDNDGREVSYGTITDDKSLHLAIKIKTSFKNTLSFSEKHSKLIKGKRNNQLKINNSPSYKFEILEKMDAHQLTDSQGQSFSYLKYLRGKQLARVLHSMEIIKADKSIRPTIPAAIQIIGTQITNNYRISKSLILDYIGKRSKKK